MEVRWSKKAQEQFYAAGKRVYDEWGKKAALKLESAVEKVEENLRTGIIEYPISKKLGVHKCLILKHNLLLYEKRVNCYFIVDFIYARSDHNY